jgi:hypothetical protein
LHIQKRKLSKNEACKRLRRAVFFYARATCFQHGTQTLQRKIRVLMFDATQANAQKKINALTD